MRYREFTCLSAALLLTANLLGAGHVAAQNMPAAYLTGYRHDTGGRLVGVIRPDPDGAGPLAFGAERYTYDLAGNQIRKEFGQLSNWQADSVAPSNWVAFTVHQSEDYTHDNAGRKLTQRLSAQGIDYAMYQYSYDSMGRLECETLRMNPAVYASLPVSACIVGSQGLDGPDRITKYTYDTRGRTLIVERAYSTPLQQAYATYSYGTKSVPATGVDAKGNKSSMLYDSANRLTALYFPSPTTPGQVSTTDYEEYTYDQNGNSLTKRTRDGQTITNGYDALDRLTSKSPGTGTPVYYGYDLRGLSKFARFDAQNGYGVSSAYDALGRLTSATINLDGVNRTVSSQYDANGNKTRVTHPDGAYFTYTYDGRDRLTQVRESAATAIIQISYDSGGRRSRLSLGSPEVASTTFTHDGISRLDSFSHDLDGGSTTNDVIFSFRYSPASQIIHRSISNGQFEFQPQPAVIKTYSTNGLNQYTGISGAGTVLPTWDARGNLTFDGSSSYTYDVENRLTSTSGASPGNLAYDPLGRLWETSGDASGTKRFIYDGDNRIAEISAGGAILRRFVHGTDVDEPLTWYEGATVGLSARRYLLADHQGSVISVANGSGGTLHVAKYDPFGVPASVQMIPFQYTGQAWLPDQKLFYYKARMYSPELGRFLQTDPAGHNDDLNLYTYVYNDPLNRVDPFGRESVEITTWAVCNYRTDGSNCGEMPHSNQARANSLATGLMIGVMALGGAEVAVTAKATYTVARAYAPRIAELSKVRGALLWEGVKQGFANAKKHWKTLALLGLSAVTREIRQEAVEKGLEGAGRAAQVARSGAAQRSAREQLDAAKEAAERARKAAKECRPPNVDPPC